MSINDKVDDKNVLLIGACVLLVVISLIISCCFFINITKKGPMMKI